MIVSEIFILLKNHSFAVCFVQVRSLDYVMNFYLLHKDFLILTVLDRLVDKMQIRIPTSQGRMMFGVMDETGLLQYGEVFFQYTVNSSIKYPTRRTDKIIHQGPVLITKNPSVVAGDVRMFEGLFSIFLYPYILLF